MGAKSFAMHKIMTIVSELARNIVSYARTGVLEFTPLKEQRSRLVIRAVDSGPGIPNLQAVLSGNYQSKTGLGKGLLGTKQLADRFEISTGPTGTVVVVEVRL
jgi:serine/threonine-protein kinase RsbT